MVGGMGQTLVTGGCLLAFFLLIPGLSGGIDRIEDNMVRNILVEEYGIHPDQIEKKR